MVKEKLQDKLLEKEDVSKFVTVVKEIPKGKRLVKDSKYQRILDHIGASSDTKFKIDIPGKTYKGVYSSFDFRVKKHNNDPSRNYDLALHVANRVLYISKEPKGSVKRIQRKKKD
jgi:hypothetical protein